MQHTLRRGFSSLSALARTHDDLPAFNAAYWVLTFMAAMLFNAGAFMVLITAHMALDAYKYAEIHRKRWLKVAEGVVRENLIDMSVIALGVAFSVYCHTALPIFAGLRGLVRTEIAVVNALVQITVKTHVLHGFVTILANLHAYFSSMHPRMGKGISPFECFAGAVLAVSVALTVAAPWILGLDSSQVAHVAGDVFIPWRL